MNTLKTLLAGLIFLSASTQIFAINDNPEPIVKADYTAILSTKKTKKEFPYKQVISFYPAKAFANYMMGGYERQVGPKHIFKVTAGYANFTDQNLQTSFNNDLQNFSALRFDLMFKYFIGKNARVFNGLYFSPYLSFKNANFQYDDFNNFNGTVWEDGQAQSIAGGFVLGFQVPIGESFTVDAFVGNAMIKSTGDYKQASRFMDSYRNAIGLISGFSFGFGF